MAVLVSAALVMLTTHAGAQVTWYVDQTHCPGPGSGTLADPFCQIQAGIDAAANGDTVLVAPGTYVEIVDFSFKSIEARSLEGAAATIISAAAAGNSVVKFENGDCVFDGFTVTGGHATLGGGGMAVYHNNTVISNCIFTGNTADFIGGGFLNFGGEPFLHHCLFFDNTAQNGGGFDNDHGMATLINCAFIRNSADADGGGVFVNTNSSNFINCTFWDNSDAGGSDESAQVSTSLGGTVNVSHSSVQGLDALEGNNNVGDDPCFVDEAGADFRLSPGSTLIDAGNNAVVTLPTDLDGRPRRFDDPDSPDTGSGVPPIVDLGPYEFGNGPGIPVVSTWGFAVLVLITLITGSIAFRRQLRIAAEEGT